MRQGEFLSRARTGIYIGNLDILVRHHTGVVTRRIRAAGKGNHKRVRILIVCQVARNHVVVVIGVTEGAHRADVNRILRLHHRSGGGCDNRARRRYMVHLELEARVRRIDAIAPGDSPILTRRFTAKPTVGSSCSRIESTEGCRSGLVAELISARIHKGV